MMIRARRRKIDGNSTISTSVGESQAVENIPTYVQPTATIITDNVPTVFASQDMSTPIDPLSTTPIVEENTSIIPTQPQSVIPPEQPKSDNTIRS